MSRYLKNPKLVAGKITGSSIGSGTSAPINVTSPINLGTIDNVKIAGSVADSFIYTDAQGNLQFGTFDSVKYLPGFSASNILLGESATASNTAGAVVLSSTTSVTEAINQLNTSLAAVGNNARRYNFTESLTWLVQHNMNTTQFFERLTSTTGERFNATVNILDQNAFEVKLTEATAGFVDVIFTTNTPGQSNNGEPPPKGGGSDTGPTAPVASFTQDFAQEPVPFTVSFTDLSTGNPTSWYWDFGDGNSSYEQNPTYEYTIPGDYTVRLLVANSVGTSEFYSGYVYAQPPNTTVPPIASFEVASSQEYTPKLVTFTDTSQNNPTSWSWDFGNGQVSTEQNPTVLFDEPQQLPYTVSLSASNSAGVSYANKQFSAWGGPDWGIVPVPDFVAEPTSGPSPLTVTFTDTTYGRPTGWAWDFGDGSTSSEQNPTHTYSDIGNYTVSLTASNVFGASPVPATTDISVSEMWRITFRDDSGATLPIFVDTPGIPNGPIFGIPVSRDAVAELVSKLTGLLWTLNGNTVPAYFDAQPEPETTDNFILNQFSYCYMENNGQTGRRLYLQGQRIDNV